MTGHLNTIVCIVVSFIFIYLEVIGRNQIYQLTPDGVPIRISTDLQFHLISAIIF